LEVLSSPFFLLSPLTSSPFLSSPQLIFQRYAVTQMILGGALTSGYDSHTACNNNEWIVMNPHQVCKGEGRKREGRRGRRKEGREGRERGRKEKEEWSLN
jgi:hypothetical protein